MANDQDGVNYTERMVPDEAHARVFWEHIERYRFAKDFVRGKRVLDIACGEGYGSAALARAGAVSVIGVDISPEICQHVREKYGLDVLIGDAQAIPLPERSVDLIISFETIEHVDSPATFIAECSRVLSPDGMLIVSTPNRPVYSANGRQNPFHRVELDAEEFVALLHTRFRSVQLYTQFNKCAAWWSWRSLSAERSPWLRIRGFWRLSSYFCPALRSHVNPANRSAADDIIQTRDSFPSSLFNPYIVRARAKGNHEQPYILVAVATGVDSG